MAENVGIGNYDSLKAQIPGNERWLDRIKRRLSGGATIVEPSVESKREVGGIVGRIENTQLYKELQDDARQEDLHLRAIQENKSILRNKQVDVANMIDTVRRGLVEIDQIQVSIGQGKFDKKESVDMARFEDAAVRLNAQFDLNNGIVRHEKELGVLRGSLPGDALHNDLEKASSIAVTENEVLALEKDLGDILVPVERVASEVSSASLDELRNLVSVGRDMAVSIVSGFEQMKVQTDDLLKRRRERFSDVDEKEIMGVLEAIRDQMKPDIIAARELPSRDGLENTLMNVIEKYGTQDRVAVINFLIEAGYENGVVKDGSLIEKFIEARSGYQEALEAAKRHQKDGETNPNSVIASYLAINMALASGSEALAVERQIALLVLDKQVDSNLRKHEYLSRLSDKYAILLARYEKLKNETLEEKLLDAASNLALAMESKIRKIRAKLEMKKDAATTERENFLAVARGELVIPRDDVTESKVSIVEQL